MENDFRSKWYRNHSDLTDSELVKKFTWNCIKILKYVKIINRFRELRHWLYYRKENAKRKICLFNKEQEFYFIYYRKLAIDKYFRHIILWFGKTMVQSKQWFKIYDILSQS